jgi:uncharacterized membrane protein YphA (DoxX/SURF4 family)
VIVAASVVLGVIFLFAAVAKISSPRQWQAQAADLGVPSGIAMAVPFVEAVIGALLVTQLARRVVAVVAAAMLLAFSVLLVTRLRQGRRPPCACFGALTAKPIGWSNVARNAVFLCVAVVIAVFG